MFNWSHPSKVAPHIVIYFDNKPQLDMAEYALEKIQSGRNGSHILEAIKKVTGPENRLEILVDETSISETGGELTYSQCKKYNFDPQSESKEYKMKVVELAGNGTGVKAPIYYNPHISVMSDKDNNSWAVRDDRLAFVSLAHEMVHAYHLMAGTSKAAAKDGNYDPEEMQVEEEHRATGIAEYAGLKFSENGVREDHHIPLRASYMTVNDMPL